MTLPKFLGSLCKRGHEAAAKFLQQGMKPFALPLRSELAPRAAAQHRCVLPTSSSALPGPGCVSEVCKVVPL